MQVIQDQNIVAAAVIYPPIDAVAAAYRCLRGTGHYALREIECAMENETLILQGTVSTFYEKQLAQAVLLNQSEAINISNRICVQKIIIPRRVVYETV